MCSTAPTARKSSVQASWLELVTWSGFCCFCSWIWSAAGILQIYKWTSEVSHGVKVKWINREASWMLMLYENVNMVTWEATNQMAFVQLMQGKMPQVTNIIHWNHYGVHQNQINYIPVHKHWLPTFRWYPRAGADIDHMIVKMKFLNEQKQKLYCTPWVFRK